MLNAQTAVTKIAHFFTKAGMLVTVKGNKVVVDAKFTAVRRAVRAAGNRNRKISDTCFDVRLPDDLSAVFTSIGQGDKCTIQVH